MKNKILIGFEESQEICKAFRNLGFEAYSCDIKPCSGECPEYHIQTDIFKALDLMKWDLIILHPPCTYTALCGNRWYYNSPLREEGVKLCKNSWDKALSICNHVVLEQPKTIMQRYIGKKSQVIQPYQFGHTETKETWLWLKGLPNLKETDNVKKEMDLLPAKEKHKIWYASPCEKRSELRSKTYSGIAKAMANQWGKLLYV